MRASYTSYIYLTLALQTQTHSQTLPIHWRFINMFLLYLAASITLRKCVTLEVSMIPLSLVRGINKYNKRWKTMKVTSSTQTTLFVLSTSKNTCRFSVVFSVWWALSKVVGVMPVKLLGHVGGFNLPTSFYSSSRRIIIASKNHLTSGLGKPGFSNGFSKWNQASLLESTSNKHCVDLFLCPVTAWSNPSRTASTFFIKSASWQAGHQAQAQITNINVAWFCNHQVSTCIFLVLL